MTPSRTILTLARPTTVQHKDLGELKPGKVMAMDKVFFLAVYLSLAAICIVYFRMVQTVVSTVSDDSGLRDSGKVLGIAVIVLVSYLVIFNATWIRRLTSLELMVIAWMGWSLVVSFQLIPKLNSMAVWLAGCAFPSCLWPCVLLVFSAIGKRTGGWSTLVHAMCVFAVMTCVLAYLMVGYASVQLSVERVQSNTVYYPLLVVPWLMLLTKRWLRYLLVLFVLSVVVYGAKRTALVAIVAGISAAIVVEIFVARKRRARLWAVLGAIGVSVMAGILLSASEAEFVMQRLNSVVADQGSGRIAIYMMFGAAIRNMDIAEKVVGYGFGASELHLGITAHNDWLESMFDFGIVGVVIYAVINVLVVRRMWLLVKVGSPIAGSYAASVLIFVVTSMTSHLVIYPNYVTLLVAYWGWIEGTVFCRVSLFHSGRTAIMDSRLEKWQRPRRLTS